MTRDLYAPECRLIHNPRMVVREAPGGICLVLMQPKGSIEDPNPQAGIFLTKRQWAGVKKQIPIKLKKTKRS